MNDNYLIVYILQKIQNSRWKNLHKGSTLFTEN